MSSTFISRVSISVGSQSFKSSPRKGKKRNADLPFPLSVCSGETIVAKVWQPCMLLCVTGKPQRRYLCNQQLHKFSVCYSTTYSANVLPSPNSCVYSFFSPKPITTSSEHQNFFADWLFCHPFLMQCFKMPVTLVLHRIKKQVCKSEEVDVISSSSICASLIRVKWPNIMWPLLNKTIQASLCKRPTAAATGLYLRVPPPPEKFVEHPHSNSCRTGSPIKGKACYPVRFVLAFQIEMTFDVFDWCIDMMYFFFQDGHIGKTLPVGMYRCSC